LHSWGGARAPPHFSPEEVGKGLSHQYRLLDSALSLKRWGLFQIVGQDFNERGRENGVFRIQGDMKIKKSARIDR
jgi:hypothetical protein